jgi:hypothetical protein
MNGLDVTLSTEIDPLRTKSLITGVLALVLCFIGWFFNRGEFFRAYLIAYVLSGSVFRSAASGVLMNPNHLVGGTWGFVIQRCLEAAVRTFRSWPCVHPALVGFPDLFVWARRMSYRLTLCFRKRQYLNIPFFVIRAIIYLPSGSQSAFF